MQIRKAERKKAKLRLGICAPSGAGKTYSALLIAQGLGKKIGMIDTEAKSGELYSHLCDYDVISLAAPFDPKFYIEAIHTFEKEGYEVIIIDSLSHAWAGEGGLLDKQGKIAASGTNSYTAWRTITPEHNRLIETMLQSPCHIIVTMRSKTEYVLEPNDKGKMVPRKIGMAPVQRDGLDYEMTVVIDLDYNHVATTSKDRTSMFDSLLFTPTKETGEKLLNWLNSGKDAEPEKEEKKKELSNDPFTKKCQKVAIKFDEELKKLCRFNLQAYNTVRYAYIGKILELPNPIITSTMLTQEQIDKVEAILFSDPDSVKRFVENIYSKETK